MADGNSSEWQAIDSLRSGQAEQGKQIAVLESQYSQLREDNREILAAVKASETALNKRFDRQRAAMWSGAAIALPIITALATALASKS